MDKKICGYVIDAHKPCLIVANKWDVACKDMKQKDLIDNIKFTLPFLDYSKVLTCCGLSGYNFKQITDGIADLDRALHLEIPTNLVNKVVQDIFFASATPSHWSEST